MSLVLLSVDSVRGDALDEASFSKSLDILAKDFSYFSNAFSHGVATPFAFPAIVSGHFPQGDGYIPNTATTLAEGISGHSAAWTNNGHLRDERGYDRGFNSFVEYPSSSGSTIVEIGRKFEFIRNSSIASKVYSLMQAKGEESPLSMPYCGAGQMTSYVREELSESSEGFVWGHWMDPHTPYHPDTMFNPPTDLPSQDKLKEIDDRFTEKDASLLTEDELELLWRLYRESIKYYDEHLSNLLEWMTEQRWYDEALILVVSDHGEYFGEHGLTHHPWDTDPYDEMLKTPLWVKYPEQTDGGVTFDHMVAHSDIVATVDENYEAADLEVPSYAVPLRDTQPRSVVSVSNRVKRLTEPDGRYFERRDGSTDTMGTVSTEGVELCGDIDFPACTTNSTGSATGVEDIERDERLEALGYR